MTEIRFVPLSQVNFLPHRWRKAFVPNQIVELATSIHTSGLIHIPILRAVDGELFLVSGERRFRAIKLLNEEGKQVKLVGGREIPAGHLPYLLPDDLPEREAKIIELEENIRRVDLSWQERCCAVAALEELNKLLDPTWTRNKTAEAAEADSVTAASNKILLAENLHRKAVATAQTEKDAIKILKNELRTEFEAALGIRVGIDQLDTRHTLEQADFVDGLSKLEDGSVDVFITDPPYGIGADSFEANMVIKHTYEDSFDNLYARTSLFGKLSYAKTKEDAHLYLFCDIQHFNFLWTTIRDEAGWNVWPRPIIWVKNIQMNHDPSHGPGRLYECILFASKGGKLVRGAKPDVIYHPIEKNVHAAQKPVGLYVELLSRSCLPGDVICDPFCGSGTIFPAANKLQLTAIGFDIDPMAVGQASLRLEEKPE